jgi:hypothetical protein
MACANVYNSLAVALITVLALLIWALVGMRHAGYGTPTASLISRLGLGAVDPRTIIKHWNIPSNGVNGVISNVLVANMPQLIFSTIYFVYNSVVTAMTMSDEWSQLANQRKGLRVSSNPQGDQRSTYFLQLPYRYSLPLLFMSGLMHWLISQSLFIINLEASSNLPDDYYSPPWSSMSCGYSPLAMILVLVVGVVMVAFVVGMGHKKLRSAMPVAGSCSLAIAAACHPPHSNPSEAVNPAAKLQWGVMNDGLNNVLHCGISDREVSDPIVTSSGAPTYL